jgi:hypothetical protein
MTSCLPMRLLMKPMMTRTPDVNTTRSENERRKRIRETLPIRNLSETLDQVANRVHTTPEQCLMSITKIARQAQGIRTGEVIAS